MITEETLKFLAGLDMTRNKEPISFKAKDDLGTRTLIIPPGEMPFSGNPVLGILKYEAMTRTRLRDGGNPLWFLRVYHQFQKESNPNDGVSFAEFVQRLHPDEIDVLSKQNTAGDDEGKKKGKKKYTDDLITLAVAVKDYAVSRSTLKRAIADGRLKSYRPHNAPRNALYKVSRAQVAANWPERN